MNKILWKEQLTPYELDYAQWCVEQGALLRKGRFAELDGENLAEEIESLGRSERWEIENRLGILLVHLVKWQYQPSGRGGSWKGTIKEQRFRLLRRIAESPSLRGYPATVLSEEYEAARSKASGETGLPESSLPVLCPYSIEQILDKTYLPESE